MLQRHARPQAVVDDRGDEPPLSRDDHLALDHRGDDEDVVGREVLRARVAHVHATPGLAERHSWRRTNRGARSFEKNAYVAGKRKPSICSCASSRNCTGIGDAAVAAAYAGAVIRIVTFRLTRAIFRTASTRSIICARVKPSGNTMRSTFGAGTVAAGGADSPPHATSDTAASAAAPPALSRFPAPGEVVGEQVRSCARVVAAGERGSEALVVRLHGDVENSAAAPRRTPPSPVPARRALPSG